MSKKQKIILGVVVLAVAAYFGYRWWKGRQDQGNAESPTGGLGTNLNSVAPELVGGSSGPEVGPAVSMPLNITLAAPANPAPPPEDNDDDDMDGRPHHRRNPVQRQRHLNPGGPMIPLSDDTGGDDEDVSPGGPGVFAGGEM